MTRIGDRALGFDRTQEAPRLAETHSHTTTALLLKWQNKKSEPRLLGGPARALKGAASAFAGGWRVNVAGFMPGLL